MFDLVRMAELRKLMRDMERVMGFQDLSPAESDIICAAADLEEASQPITTMALMEHELVGDVSRPTFFRAIRSLVSRGLLGHAEGSRKGRYVVTASKAPGQ